MATLTKIFRHGNSDALRIPADFRLPSREVELHQSGYGFMVIDPAKREEVMDALHAAIKEAKRNKRARAAA